MNLRNKKWIIVFLSIFILIICIGILVIKKYSVKKIIVASNPVYPVVSIPTGEKENFIVLRGNISPMLSQATFVKSTDLNRQLIIGIGMNFTNQENMNKMVKDIYDPKSPNYQKYLSPSEAMQLYGPDIEGLKMVKAYLNANQIEITEESNNIAILATGTVAHIDAAFHISINDYILNGKAVYSANTDPSVPANIAPFIAWMGLDNISALEPLNPLQAR